MALLNASGQPVATKIHSMQIDIPVADEAVVTIGTPNWGALISAGIQLVFAMMTGNAVAIASAIQALINAFMGK